MATAAQREHIKIMKSDHPAAAVVNAFFDMRESCTHYRGMIEKEGDDQCKHEDNRRQSTRWCAMDSCPLLQERARAESVGWD
jgi:hypothetical protein